MGRETIFFWFSKVRMMRGLVFVVLLLLCWGCSGLLYQPMVNFSGVKEVRCHQCAPHIKELKTDFELFSEHYRAIRKVAGVDMAYPRNSHSFIVVLSGQDQQMILTEVAMALDTVKVTLDFETRERVLINGVEFVK